MNRKISGNRKIQKTAAVFTLLILFFLIFLLPDQGADEVTDKLPENAVAIAPEELTSIDGQQGISERPGQTPNGPNFSRLENIANTFTVLSIKDSGLDTLRDAIQKANNSPGVDKIIFDSSLELFATPQVILLASPLPDITDDLMIDGYIEGQLWKASGVTISGNRQFPLLNITAGTTASISHLTLSEGFSDKPGGAVYNEGILALQGMLLSLNHSKEEGGALYNKGHLHIINSTFYANSSESSGAAIYNDSGSLHLTHITGHMNTSTSGIALFNDGKMNLYNSIFYATEGFHSGPRYDCWSTTSTTVHAAQNILGFSKDCGEVFTNKDPGLGNPGYFNGPTKTIPISARGPAHNWGDNAFSLGIDHKPLTWDQRGNGDPRFVLGVADIGAFESQPKMSLVIDTTSEADIRSCTKVSKDCSLTGALNLINNGMKDRTISFDPDVFKERQTLKLKEGVLIPKNLTLDASMAAGQTIVVSLGQTQSLKTAILKNIRVKSEKP